MLNILYRNKLTSAFFIFYIRELNVAYVYLFCNFWIYQENIYLGKHICYTLWVCLKDPFIIDYASTFLWATFMMSDLYWFNIISNMKTQLQKELSLMVIALPDPSPSLWRCYTLQVLLRYCPSPDSSTKNSRLTSHVRYYSFSI